MRRTMVLAFGLVLLMWRPALAQNRNFLVCLPLGEGSSEAATKYMKPFLRRLERLAGWPEGSVKGKYVSSISGCEAAVRSLKPAFGLLSQGLYLEKRRQWRLKVVGRVDMPRGAGHRLYLVVKKGMAKTLDDLKGKTLKSNHVAEEAFLSKVVFRGKIDAGRFFKLVATTSPLRGFKAVHRGRADCTLVNDDELAIMKRRREGQDLEVIYKSPPLPGTPVVAFRRNASAKDIATFRAILGKVCSGEGRSVCRNAMIRGFSTASDGTYSRLVRMFRR